MQPTLLSPTYISISRSAILVDFCFYNLLFCEEHNFTPEQASAFFAIMKRVFEHAFESKVIANRTALRTTRLS